MKKLLLLIGLPLLFLVSCNDNNPTSSEVTNEKTSEDTEINDESSNNNETNEQIEEPNDKKAEEQSDSKETSETPSTQEPSQGNIENGGGYKDDSGEEWIYLG